MHKKKASKLELHGGVEGFQTVVHGCMSGIHLARDVRVFHAMVIV